MPSTSRSKGVSCWRGPCSLAFAGRRAEDQARPAGRAVTGGSTGDGSRRSPSERRAELRGSETEPRARRPPREPRTVHPDTEPSSHT